MVPPRLTPGRAGHPVLVGRAVRPDRAGTDHHPARHRRAYLGFQLGSLWYISLDYINHQTSLNGTQAQADPDGKIRIVVVRRESGCDELGRDLGHRKGYLQFRWQRVSRELTEADGPTVALVDIDEVAAALPYYESNKISEEDWRARIALRQKQIGNRMVG